MPIIIVFGFFLIVAFVLFIISTFNENKDLKIINQNLSEEIISKKNKICDLEKDISKNTEENNNLQFDIKNLKKEILKKDEKLNEYKNISQSNLTLFPCAAKVFSEYITMDLELKAKSLDWGSDFKRLKKVEDIRAIRKSAQDQMEKSKWAEYQLSYLIELYPTLQDVIETDYEELNISIDNIKNYDPIRNHLSKEEYEQLSETERNQLALDRYIESRKKSKWQIGRDYELYIGYLYEKKGYKVDYTGSNLGIEDLGRDLIIANNEKISIIQCKYWSKEKQIHEKHIMQLYGTTIAYGIENSQSIIPTGILITNISLSETAKKYADILGIKYVEYKPISDFPRIKCNIGRDEYGYPVKIYHLPMDISYDRVKIEKEKGECIVNTVLEAEQLGFRRAYKWFGSS